VQASYLLGDVTGEDHLLDVAMVHGESA